MRPLDAEAHQLKDRLLTMGELVENQIVHAKQALVESDKDLAREVIVNDHFTITSRARSLSVK